jgi:hypothetical protein
VNFPGNNILDEILRNSKLHLPKAPKIFNQLFGTEVDESTERYGMNLLSCKLLTLKRTWSAQPGSGGTASASQKEVTKGSIKLTGLGHFCEFPHLQIATVSANKVCAHKFWWKDLRQSNRRTIKSSPFDYEMTKRARHSSSRKPERILPGLFVDLLRV